MSIKALILAGGSGKEMLPLSKYRPKTMLRLHQEGTPDCLEW